MVFSSSTFLFYFLPLVFLAYFLVPGLERKNRVLLVFSLFFYFTGEGVMTWVMVYSILLNYLFAKVFSRIKDGPWKKLGLLFCLFLNLLPLFYFKYFNFTLGNIAGLLGRDYQARKMIMPIGISFFTFQALSYVLDVYKKRTRAQDNPLKVGLYISLFPQLIAGPIVRYETVAGEIEKRTHSLEDISEGLLRFSLGFAKKILIANQMALVANYYYDDLLGKTSILGFFLAMVSFSLQIYYDFSGYSDMAIGLGRIFGFHFLENFNFPYMARSITDFWRRWHMSLSSWFKDYVYIPLGGNRKGKARQVLNLFIVWFLTGLWHGAYWNYIFWGLFYFLLLIGEKFLLKEKDLGIFGHILTLVLVFFAWMIFRCEDLSVLGNLLKSLTGAYGGLTGGGKDFYPLVVYGLPFFLALVFSTPLEKIWFKKRRESLGINLLGSFVLMAAFGLAVVYMLTGDFNPFIYFRF